MLGHFLHYLSFKLIHSKLILNNDYSVKMMRLKNLLLKNGRNMDPIKKPY